MRITRVKIVPIDAGNLVAFADITIDNCFRVRDLRILRRPSGYHIAMPQLRESGGKYKDIAFALDAKTRKMIEEIVTAEYEKVAGKRTQ
jgi:stage V sporulation protein G